MIHEKCPCCGGVLIIDRNNAEHRLRCQCGFSMSTGGDLTENEKVLINRIKRLDSVWRDVEVEYQRNVSEKNDKIEQLRYRIAELEWRQEKGDNR